MPSSPSPSPSTEQPHWNPVVVALVGVICTVFLLLSYYKILQYHLCVFHRTTSSRNRVQRRLLDRENPDDPSFQFQSRALDSYIMHSLPITQFEKKNEEELGERKMDCAVCLGDFEEGEWIKRLPKCSHLFHASCIDIWFQNHSRCPICRSSIFYTSMHGEVSISMETLVEHLSREDFLGDGPVSDQVLQSHIL
ncbi:hypothetical protein NMG60_11014635 [Bertholletia excelsa]